MDICFDFRPVFVPAMCVMTLVTDCMPAYVVSSWGVTIAIIFRTMPKRKITNGVEYDFSF